MSQNGDGDAPMDLFDDLDDAETGAVALDPGATSAAEMALPSEGALVQAVTGAVPVIVGLVLLGLPGVAPALALGLTLATLAAATASTMVTHVWPDASLRHVLVGSLVGGVVGSVLFTAIHLALLAWRVL